MAAFAIQMGSRGTAVRAYVRDVSGRGWLKQQPAFFPSVLLLVLSDHIVLLRKRQTAVSSTSL